MLDVSRIQAGKLELVLEKVDICHVIEEVVEHFRPHFENVETTMKLTSCEKLFVDIDVFRFDQVLNNIMSNALKYAPARPVHITVTEENDAVCIAIKDQGKGILTEDLEKIFQRFERAASETDPSGLGLGLFISREIIVAHRGKLWAESKIDEGTTFFISIPLSHS
jgi:signal transduction histidine kinase